MNRLTFLRSGAAALLASALAPLLGRAQQPPSGELLESFVKADRQAEETWARRRTRKQVVLNSLIEEPDAGRMLARVHCDLTRAGERSIVYVTAMKEVLPVAGAVIHDDAVGVSVKFGDGEVVSARWVPMRQTGGEYGMGASWHAGDAEVMYRMYKRSA